MGENQVFKSQVESQTLLRSHTSLFLKGEWEDKDDNELGGQKLERTPRKCRVASRGCF